MQRAHSGMLRHDQQLGHSQQMIGHQSLFSSQEQLQNVHETSDFMASAPSDSQQLATNQLEAQSDSRIYYEQCPKHGGPTRSPESNEDVVGSVAVRPEEMVVKESSGIYYYKEKRLASKYFSYYEKVLIFIYLTTILALLNSGGGGNAEILPSDHSMIPLGTISSSAGLLANSACAADNGQQIGTNTTAAPSEGTKGDAKAEAAKKKLAKKNDPKEIMKKRRERAICIDRVSRVIFPSTFILLNIIYWLVFSEILEAIQYTTGIDIGAPGDDDEFH